MKGPNIQNMGKVRRQTGGLPLSGSRATSRLPPPKPPRTRPLEEYRIRAAVQIDRTCAAISSSLFAVDEDRNYVREEARKALQEIREAEDPDRVKEIAMATIRALDEMFTALALRYLNRESS